MSFLRVEVIFFLLIALCNVSAKAPSLFSRDLAVDGVNATITPLSLSSDKQSYYFLLKTGEIPFRVALDTGSSDLWLTTSDCRTEACKKSPHYPLSYQDPTFVAVNSNTTAFKASYGDGTVASGFVAKETVNIGNMTVPNQVLGLVTDSNVTFADSINGILGLGFPRLSSINRNTTDSSPFLATLAERGLVRYPLFGVGLTRGSYGTLALGAIDGTVVKNLSNVEWGEVVQFPPIGNENNQTSYWHWALPLQSVSVNGSPLTLSPSYPNMTGGLPIGLFDVGTSGIYGPWSDVAKLYSGISEARLVDESGQWAVPCDTQAVLSFKFGSRNFTLQPADYLIGPTSGNPKLCLSWPRANIPTPDGIDWVLGSPFLRTVYTIFSYGIDTKESPMIGLYALNTTNMTASISSFFSSASATVATILPNSLLNTPSATTAPYGLNSSFTAPTGGVVASGLANSTYSPILGQEPTNISALPIITASPTVETFTLTDATGGLTTTTSRHPVASVVLGVPPGWSENGALSSLRALKDGSFKLLPIVIMSWTTIYTLSDIVFS
ncbi:hypothetical protein V5O48_006795 [Marasmius crinis-equi]|uniref:Peptidase A1 domain-containing protein n=1 Tax=Marasmius crinis-equi TaxID=585013 RepID=A0ABR3FIH7_9AGAR